MLTGNSSLMTQYIRKSSQVLYVITFKAGELYIKLNALSHICQSVNVNLY